MERDAVAFRLDPPQSTQFQTQRLAIDRIDKALDRLRRINTVANPKAETKGDNAAHLHAVRRRCKQARALARLVRPALGDDFAPFNTAVRDAARALAPLRNAHVSEQLLQALDAAAAGAAETRPSTPDTSDLVVAVASARHQLRLARRLIESWQLPEGFAPLAAGLERTYRRGQRGLATARLDPAAENLHEWRKDTKDLWYQLRLLERIAPSVLDPLIEQLGTLGDDLGHHHDITLLIDGLANEARFITKRERKEPGVDPDAATALADIQTAADRAEEAQDQLGQSARRIGTTIYAETSASFIARIGAYWDITARFGPEATSRR